MSQSTMIDLNKISEPKFEFKIEENGATVLKSYDPWEVSAKLEGLSRAGDGTIDGICDAIREAFGFPRAADVLNAPEAERPKTLTRHQCMVVQTSLAECIQGLEVSKKALKLSPK